MDGQDPNRRGHNDPSYTNHLPPSCAPQNIRSNSFSDLSGNRFRQRPILATPVSRQDSSTLQQLSFGQYYGPANSSAGTNSLNQPHYQNNNHAPAVSSQQSYYNAPAAYSTTGPYQSATHSALPNSFGFSPNQYSQRQLGQPSQMPMGYNHNALYDLDDPLLDPPVHAQQHLLPLPYDQQRQQAAFAAQSLAQLPTLPQNPPSGLSGQAIVNQTPFEVGMDRVYRALGPIVNIITSHGDLNQASTLLLTLSEQFLSTVEQLQLTVDHPEHEVRGLQLWRNFNHAWLALFYAQYRRTYDLQQAGASVNDPQLMSQATIYRVMTELSELAREHVEDRGLLDHEFGVWEAQITREGADRCLELLRPAEAENE